MPDNLQEIRKKLLDAALAAQDYDDIDDIKARLAEIGFVELSTKDALSEVKYEVFEAQNQIIKLQADAIEELLLITMLNLIVKLLVPLVNTYKPIHMLVRHVRQINTVWVALGDSLKQQTKV